MIGSVEKTSGQNKKQMTMVKKGWSDSKNEWPKMKIAGHL
jgi:hypothetical protein